MSNEILLLEEVAEMTRLPRATLRFYRHRGEGGPRSFKIGNRVLPTLRRRSVARNLLRRERPVNSVSRRPEPPG
jgi:hypothetical protein